MTINELIESAKMLKKPGLEVQSEYSEKKERLVAEINARMRARGDLLTLLGGDHIMMMEDNHHNHARFMESIFLVFDLEVLVETVIWVLRAYRAHGFQLTYWPAQLNTWISVLREFLSPGAFEQIFPFYNWMLIHQPLFVVLSDELLQEDERHNLLDRMREAHN